MDFQKSKFNKYSFFSFFAVVGIGVGVFVSVIYASAAVPAAAWTAPTDTAPACSASNPACNAPINVSGNAQRKNGLLGVDALGVYGAFHAWGSPALTGAEGLTVNNGAVGIGTANPQQTLHVVGNIRIDGLSGAPDTSALIIGSGNASNFSSFTLPCSFNSYDSTACGTDTADSNPTTQATISNCAGKISGTTLNDVARNDSISPGSSSPVPTWWSRTLTCYNPSEPLYKMKNVNGTLTFTDQGNVNTLTLAQSTPAGQAGLSTFAGDLTVNGNVNAAGVYIGTTRKDTVWDAKEPAIVAGTASQYWAGDKTWQTLPTPDLTNLDATNLTSGTVAPARIDGSYTGIKGVGTITAGTWNGTAIVDTYIASAATWNAKISSANPTLTGNVTMPGSGIWNSSGKVGIGTITPSQLLSVYNGNLVLVRDQGSSVTAGMGPQIILESPSGIAVTTQETSRTQCGGPGQPACPTTDDTPDHSLVNFYVCPSGSGGLTYSYDVGHITGDIQYYVRSIKCISGTSQYSIATNAGTLQFMKNDGTPMMVIGQDGNIGIGTVAANYKLDVSGDIRAIGGIYVGTTRKDTVWDAVTTKEPAITAASGAATVQTAKYWAGNKTWQTLPPAPDLSGYAPLASPTFTGTVTVPTPTAASAATVAATKEYVDNKVASGAVNFSSITSPVKISYAGGTTLALTNDCGGGCTALLISGQGKVGASINGNGDAVFKTISAANTVTCPAGMTASFTYVNEGEDINSGLPAPSGNTAVQLLRVVTGGFRNVPSSAYPSIDSLPADTCDGDRGVYGATGVYTCPVDASKTCNDVWDRVDYGSYSQYALTTVTCKTHAIMKCVQP